MDSVKAVRHRIVQFYAALVDIIEEKAILKLARYITMQRSSKLHVHLFLSISVWHPLSGESGQSVTSSKGS